jgi:hypothetical protein
VPKPKPREAAPPDQGGDEPDFEDAEIEPDVARPARPASRGKPASRRPRAVKR